MKQDKQVRVPFTEDQVASLNAYQHCGYFHQYTCRCGADLVATTGGWVCEEGCGHTQNWAHRSSADWSWKPLAEQTAAMFGRTL